MDWKEHRRACLSMIFELPAVPAKTSLHARVKLFMAAMSLDAVLHLPRFNCVNVAYKDKTYELRTEQLTTKNVSKVFNLIPDVILVSANGTVSLPDDHGKFSDVDDSIDHKWTVQGVESSKRVAGSVSPTRAGGSGKWEPSAIPSRLQSSGTNSATSHSSSSSSSRTSNVS